jgi:hypothetical protein
MPEGDVNAEVAHHLREHGEHGSGGASHAPGRRTIEVVEILEAVVLAVVALATALGRCRAALFDGGSARWCAASSRLRVRADDARLNSGQEAIRGSATFTARLEACDAGDRPLMTLLERRFLPGSEEALDDRVAPVPWTDPGAPPGPRHMPSFEDPPAEKAVELSKEASHACDPGVETRAGGEKHVRVTVLLASSLCLGAIGQRLKTRGVRYAVNAVAGLVLAYCLYLIATYPHICPARRTGRGRRGRGTSAPPHSRPRGSRAPRRPPVPCRGRPPGRRCAARATATRVAPPSRRCR